MTRLEEIRHRLDMRQKTDDLFARFYGHAHLDVEYLLSLVDELRKSPWIAVSERLPEEQNVQYIVLRENAQGGFDCQVTFGSCWGSAIKFWMPIPWDAVPSE